MNQYPLYPEFLSLMHTFDNVNIAVGCIAVFIVVWVGIVYLRYPRLMPVVRTLLSYSFFIVALLALVGGL